jgi:hypothetical protein
MKAKEDRLMEEVGKLNEEMRRVTAQHDSFMKDLAEATDLLHKLGQFPPSVKLRGPARKSRARASVAGQPSPLSVLKTLAAHLHRLPVLDFLSKFREFKLTAELSWVADVVTRD